MTNHYRTLGVDPKAEPAAIRSAYLALIRRHHPDNGEEADPARAQAVTAAWDVLRDPARRAAYDEGRQARFTPGQVSGGVSTMPAPRARGGAAARNLFLLLAAGTIGLGWWASQQPQLAPPAVVADTAARPKATPAPAPRIRSEEDERAVRRSANAAETSAHERVHDELAADLPLKPSLPDADPPALPVRTALARPVAVAPRVQPAPAGRPVIEAARPSPAPVPTETPARIDLAPLERHLQLLTDQSMRFGTEAKRARLFATNGAFQKRLGECRDDGCRRDTYLRRNVEVAEIMRN